MIRLLTVFRVMEASWPRTSGDDPDWMAEGSHPGVLAPHERG